MSALIDPKLTQMIKLLTSRNETISVAESCTGGYLSYLLTKVPGSSKVFKEGFVTYSIESKSKNLKIQKDEICKVGAVSPETAILMSRHVKEVSNSTYGISITGNAGPDITEKSTHVGELYVGITTPKDTFCYWIQIDGTRNQIRKLGAEKTIDLLSQLIGENQS